MDLAFHIILWSGLAAGFVHVFAGIDHLAALLPLSVGKRWKAALLGVRWGIGHSAGVVLIAVVALEFKELLEPEWLAEHLGHWSERLVGVMLVALGIFGFRSVAKLRIHNHTHEHLDEKGEKQRHQHPHVHFGQGHSKEEEQASHSQHTHKHTAFLAGILHGLAGMGHWLGVLPAAMLENRLQSYSYLLTFVVGTLCAMMLFAAGIGLGSARLGERGPRVMRRIMFLASGLTVIVGVLWILFPLLGLELPSIFEESHPF